MSYFSYLPDVKVRVNTFRENNIEPYVVAKNIFRRIKIVDSIADSILGFEQITIGNNERPDQVAFDQYGDTNLDWIILLCNNVINMYNDWPLSEVELTNLVSKKYQNLNGVHHYETNEIRDDSNRIILKKGMQVNSTFRYYRPNGNIVPNASIPISNWEYEKGINDAKSNIWILKEEYVEEFIDEFEELLQYVPNAEIEDTTGIKFTPQAVDEIFRSHKISYTSPYGRTSSIQFASGLELVNKVVTRTVTESGAVETSTSDSSAGAVVTSSGVVAGSEDSSGTSGGSSASSSDSSSDSGSSGGSSGGGYGGY